MRRWPGVLAVLACMVSGCSISAHAPAPTSTPRATASPTSQPIPRPASTPYTGVTPTSVPAPLTLYSQQQVGRGKYELVNNFTEQFVEVTANGVRRVCPRGGQTACTAYLKIGVTEYSGNVQVKVSPRHYVLVSTAGARYVPATPQQAAGAVQAGALLQAQVLTPDDDGDFATGTIVFLVPDKAGRFSLVWEGRHVATMVLNARGRLSETR